MPFALSHKRVWIAGHSGMVGGALCRALKGNDCILLTADRTMLDLRDQGAVNAWISSQKPDAIVLAAATVGGIEANRSRPAEFLYDNLMIAAHVIHAAAENRVSKLLYLGSSCIYPRDTIQPISEKSLLTGALEPTNEWYAVAKIAGVKLCQAYRKQNECDFISAMPCNLYGPGDTYDAVQSHVIPAMLLKFHQAKLSNAQQVTLWGTGNPLREFLHVDDLAAGLLHLLQNYSDDAPVNIGSGVEISIRDLATLVAEVTGYTGQVVFDSAMPDGTPRKVLDNTRINAMGWRPRVALRDGLRAAYVDYMAGNVRHAA